MPIYRMAIDVDIWADDEASARAQAEAFRLEWIDGLDVDIWCDDDATDPDVRVYFKDDAEIEVENIEDPDDEDEEGDE